MNRIVQQEFFFLISNILACPIIRVVSRLVT